MPMADDRDKAPGVNRTVVLFLQNRAHRAGAQTCLERLWRSAALQSLQPVLICGEEGWLTRAAREAGVPCVVEKFPRSRSLAGRMFKNTAFARNIQRRLTELGLKPTLVQANDHAEALLALELAKIFDAKRALFLRSGGMTGRDYKKYRCQAFDLCIAVGDELQQRAQSWNRTGNVKLIYDGLYAAEFSAPKAKAPFFPKKILVIGSPLADKGWADLTEALFHLQAEMNLSSWQFDFTGAKPDPKLNNLKLERIAGIKMNFLGRVENFKELVLSYDLVINPSREESFGMAAMEVLAYGVPLLSSRTGEIEKVLTSPAMLFRPHDPEDLTRALSHLVKQWNSVDLNVVGCQTNILKHFNMQDSAKKVFHGYQELMQ